MLVEHLARFPVLALHEDDVRSLGVTKPSPLDFNPCVTKPSLLLDFSSDMLPFSIAIGPDKQGFAVLSLFLDILGNA